MVMTKQASAAKAREAKAAKLEAENAVPTPPATDGSEPTTYKYVGGMNAVLVVLDGTSYEFRLHEPVHLPHGVANLDAHPDFERVSE